MPRGPSRTITLTPFRRCQVRPAHATREEIFTAVLHHVDKRLIRLDNPTLEISR